MATDGNRNDSDHARSAATSISLLERARANDQGAWQRLIDVYGRLVYYWCRQTVPPGEIEDVYQEVFKAVVANLHTFRKDMPGQSFRGWLLAITNSKIADCFRRVNRQPAGTGGSTAFGWLQQIPESAYDSSAHSDSPNGTGDDVIMLGLLKSALDVVRSSVKEESSWESFWLTVVEGRNATEAAIEIGSTKNAVRHAKARLLNKLREELRHRLEELSELDDLGFAESRLEQMLTRLRDARPTYLAKT
ncbi:MAG: RNA polymerase sigma factor [Pirellulales bacterium]